MAIWRSCASASVTAAFMRLAINVVSPRRASCLTEACPCGFTHDMERPLPECVQHAAIYSRGDGVVDWHDSQEPEPRLNHEVGGTHIGLVYNSRAYGVLARLLAGASPLRLNGKGGR